MDVAGGVVMGSTFPLLDLLVFLFVSGLLNLPVLWVLKKIGWSRWLVILAMLPFVNFVFLYVVAFARWPNEPSAEDIAPLPSA